MVVGRGGWYLGFLLSMWYVCVCVCVGAPRYEVHAKLLNFVAPVVRHDENWQTRAHQETINV